MYPTAEVRWFYPGPIPPEVARWFAVRAGTPDQEPPRTDHYLRVPTSQGLNLKLREGRIEVKLRVGEPEVARLHQRVTGVVERWRKWSFELAEPGGESSPMHLPGSSWIPVRKDRRLRTHQVTEEGTVLNRTPQGLTQGCETELTGVVAQGQVWWTLAFEAFGEEASLRDNLLLVAAHVLGASEPPRLEAHRSQGYAAWLVAVGKEEAQR